MTEEHALFAAIFKERKAAFRSPAAVKPLLLAS